MEEKLLEKLGLTGTEAKIYLALLGLGQSLAGSIAAKSKVHRRNVYDALERLIEKGLVNYVFSNNRRYFSPVNPKRLLEITREKESIAQQIMPELELAFKSRKKDEEAVFFKGKQGLKAVFDDQINEKKEILIIGAFPNADKIVKYYFPKYDKERAKKKINIKAIFSKKIASKIILAEIKYLPEHYNTNTAINIYGNKVAIILWAQEPFAILFNNKDIADSYRNYFKLMWNTAKK